MTRQSFPHNHNNINRLPASILLSLLRRMNNEGEYAREEGG